MIRQYCEPDKANWIKLPGIVKKVRRSLIEADHYIEKYYSSDSEVERIALVAIKAGEFTNQSSEL